MPYRLKLEMMEVINLALAQLESFSSLSYILEVYHKIRFFYFVGSLGPKL